MPNRVETSASIRGKSGRRAVCGFWLVWLAAASVAVLPALISEAKADSMAAEANRVFELRVYHALPGKLPALEARFRETTSKLLDKHNLKVIGFWEGDDNSLIYIVAHRSREDAKKNWDAMLADPEFLALVKAGAADKRVDKIDSTYMEPTDFSPMR